MNYTGKIIIFAATVQTILIVFGGSMLFVGNSIPTCEQATNLITTGWRLIGFGIGLFLIELAAWLLIKYAEVQNGIY
ncbi:MAG: hypothetical protein GF364_05560 [Candidatus Lokiarchaeota archaeon]|nr:hypothetical protein [Candidatus Lokiarchaeota archaeon]